MHVHYLIPQDGICCKHPLSVDCHHSYMHCYPLLEDTPTIVPPVTPFHPESNLS